MSLVGKLTVLGVAATFLLLPGCSAKSGSGPEVAPKPPRRPRQLGPGFQLRLEEASLPAAAAAEARTPVAPAKPLGDAETNALLARLQPIGAEAGDVKTF
jgi:hypothetical protein